MMGEAVVLGLVVLMLLGIGARIVADDRRERRRRRSGPPPSAPGDGPPA